MNRNVFTLPQMNAVANLVFCFSVRKKFILLDPDMRRVGQVDSKKSILKLIVDDFQILRFQNFNGCKIVDAGNTGILINLKPDITAWVGMNGNDLILYSLHPIPENSLPVKQLIFR